MYTIAKSTENEINHRKSRFIAYLYKVDVEKNVKEYLDKMKKKHREATHVCYGYKIDTFMKCSDDGEPSGTAGLPILHILNQNNLDHILCIVVRYYGGVKLGAGGLIRAYAESAKLAIESTTIIELVLGARIECIFSYDKSKTVTHLVKDYFIYKKIYDSNITYLVDIEEARKEECIKKLVPYCISVHPTKSIWLELK